MNQQWKEKHISKFVTLGAPWTGAVDAAENLITGLTIKYLSYIYKTKFRPMIQSFPSIYFLLPTLGYNESFINYAGEEISADNYDRFFELLDVPDGKEMWMDSKDTVSQLEHPGVDTTCIFGSKIDTTEKLIFKSSNDWPDSPQVIKGDGDGTVHRTSLEACTKWAENSDRHFSIENYENLSHLGVRDDDRVIQYMLKLISLEQALREPSMGSFNNLLRNLFL